MSALVKLDSLSQEGIKDMKQAAKSLMCTPHYAKLGEAGIFAIISMAKSIGADPLQCLNGGLYNIKGKIEMDGRLMMALIRASGHSVTKDKRSDDKMCILHGKRHDSGDTWTESFSIEDAKKAGLLGQGVWSKFTKDMLQWRALSRLARFLFADIIKGCYVTGEISEAPELNDPVNEEEQEKFAQEIDVSCELVEESPDIQHITVEEAKSLDKLIGDDHVYRATLLDFLEKHYKVKTILHLPSELLERVMDRVAKNIEDKEVQHAIG